MLTYYYKTKGSDTWYFNCSNTEKFCHYILVHHKQWCIGIVAYLPRMHLLLNPQSPIRTVPFLNPFTLREAKTGLTILNIFFYQKHF